MTDHPITPPPEVKQHMREAAPPYHINGSECREHWLMDRAAQWGYEQRDEATEAELQEARDEELEAIIRLAGEAALPEKDRYFDGLTVAAIRAARRPKPPTLAEQGMEALRSTPCTEQRHYDALFTALNRLKQLEDSND